MKSKGDVLEKIVQKMLASRTTAAEHNKRIHTVSRDGRTRQIDVLLTDDLPRARQQRLAECKNEAVKADTEHIDAVVGKAKDVGFAPHDVVYVTTSGYTEDALKRAKAENIRTLVLYGLSESRMAPAPTKARQILVYVQLSIIQVNLNSFFWDTREALGMSELGLSNLSPFSTILNTVHNQWVGRKIGDRLGEADLEVPLPVRPLYTIAGNEKQLPPASVRIQVNAHLVAVPGEATMLELIEVPEGRIDSFRVDSQFFRDEPRVFASSIQSEEELVAALKPDAPVQLVVGRQRLPRINCLNRFYWPVSAQSLRRMYSLVHNGVDPRSFSVQDTEGSTIQAFYEAPLDGSVERPAESWR